MDSQFPINKKEGGCFYLWKGSGSGTAMHIPGGHCLLLCNDVVHSGSVPDNVKLGRRYIRLY
jgi:hypothetical protein